jgi:hypothetical protein
MTLLSRVVIPDRTQWSVVYNQSTTSGQRCGEHDVAAYLARVNAMERAFRRFADEQR